MALNTRKMSQLSLRSFLNSSTYLVAYDESITDPAARSVRIAASALAGAKGTTGDKGPLGDRGPQGFIGERGPQGLPGVNGNNGLDGNDGEDGANGNKGTAGDKGPLGDKGPIGDKGPLGDVGPQGGPGVSGADGNQLRSGNGAPPNNIGIAGDYWIDNTNRRLYGPKGATTWPGGYVTMEGTPGPQGDDGAAGAAGAPGGAGPAGAPGTAGTNGVDGKTILSGTGAPANGVGNNGDFYIKNDAPKTIYGPKAAGVWPAGTSLIGEAVASGNATHAAPRWRVRVRATPSGVTALAEVQFRTIAGTSQQATGGTASAGSAAAGFEAARAFDTDNATLWSPVNAATLAAGTAWVAYEFPVNRSVVEVAIRGSTVVADSPSSFVVEKSYDGVTWSVALDRAAEAAWTSNELRLFAVPVRGAMIGGTGAPALLMGEVGDFYIDGVAGFIYGPKLAAGWGAGRALGAAAALAFNESKRWRVRVTSTPSGRIAIAETQFRSVAAGAEFPSGGSFLNGSPIAGFEAEKAFDGSVSTLWSTASNTAVAGGTAWYGYAYASAKVVNQLLIQAPSSGLTDTPSAFVLEKSNDDGATWQVVLTRSAEAAWSASEIRLYTVPTA